MAELRALKVDRKTWGDLRTPSWEVRQVPGGEEVTSVLLGTSLSYFRILPMAGLGRGALWRGSAWSFRI